VKLVFTEAES